MAARREAAQAAGEEKMEQSPVDTINQVRELLFGDSARAIDTRTAELDARLDRIAAEMNERFNQVERRISELQAQTEERHLAAIADIGDAIVQLGTSVRSMGAAGRKR